MLPLQTMMVRRTSRYITCHDGAGISGGDQLGPHAPTSVPSLGAGVSGMGAGGLTACAMLAGKARRWRNHAFGALGGGNAVRLPAELVVRSERQSGERLVALRPWCVRRGQQWS